MIMQGKDIIILGLMRFDLDIESTNYTIAKHLAKNNRVFYVDNPYTWRDVMFFKGTDELARRKKQLGLFADGVIDTDNPNLKVVISPALASIHFLPEGAFYRLALSINQMLIVNRIKRVIKKFGIKDYVFINSYNFHYPKVGDKLNARLKVYHCVDPLVSWYDLKHGKISEAHVVKNSDVIICSSKQLCVEKTELNPNTYFVPNAADISHSQKALDPGLPVAEAIAKLPKPIMGYFGAIERRIDYEILKTVIEKNPDKSFVFVGPQGKEYIPDWFYNTPNVYLPGRMPYQDMPAIVKGFDVALLPFKKDEVSRTIFPLKLFEYLGAGKPVVAVDFNEDLKDFTADTVYYCATAAEFSDAINKALAENAAVMVPKRLAVATDNTWDKRAAEFSEILNNYFEQKAR